MCDGGGNPKSIRLVFSGSGRTRRVLGTKGAFEGCKHPAKRTPLYVSLAVANSRDLALARNHFLFLGGYGNIHKGLDLALDAFASLDQPRA